MYKVVKSFSGSPDGCRVIEYEKGQILPISSDFSTDLAEVALAEGWTVPAADNKTIVKKASVKKAPVKKAKK